MSLANLWLWLAAAAALSLFAPRSLAQARPQSPAAEVRQITGRVEILRSGSTEWTQLGSNIVYTLSAGDRLRTGPASRALLQMRDGSPTQVKEHSVLVIAPEPGGGSFIDLLRGAVYFFHRDKPGTHPVRTPSFWAVVRGTEFHVEVGPNDESTLALLSGVVDVTNALGAVQLFSGEVAVAQRGAAPQRAPMINATNVMQWCLYYPAVMDPAELAADGNFTRVLSNSLSAYRAGDLTNALARLPPRPPATDAERVYFAQLLLVGGNLDDAKRLLTSVAQNGSNPARLAKALLTMIAVVQGTPPEQTSFGPAQLASEWLVESYRQQAQRDLRAARDAARRSVAVAPQFSFAWARVAELEFSFGENARALDAVNRSLDLAARNAHALTVQGFLHAARNDIGRATVAFQQAIDIDGRLGNAWLGRGLCRIRRGDLPQGLRDLEVAAALEPQRALLRSYLGKAWSDASAFAQATNELGLAKALDANDPTPWLYSAIVKHRNNEVNAAIHDLQMAEDLNDNRALFRSEFLLDQDAAVQSVRRAQFYFDAGLADVSVWEATRAVNADYASFSAHLFLADSFQRQRNFRSVSQRFETAAVNEYLLAALLSPVGAGTLAHSVSQHEYSKLFEQDGFGFASSTEYLSRDAWTQTAAQYGTVENTSYAVSAFYQSDRGQWRNNDVEQTEFSLQVQQQLTPQDILYARVIHSEAGGGDLAQYYDPHREANPLLRFDETQHPLLLLGYRREWGPGLHTLALFSRLDDTLRVTDPRQHTVFVATDADGNIIAKPPIRLAQKYRNELEIYSGELQQIWQAGDSTLVFGTRYQFGDVGTKNLHTSARILAGSTSAIPVSVSPSQRTKLEMNRFTAYAYEHWRIAEPLLLVAGLSYDALKYPRNFRYAPLATDEETTSRVSPKAGAIWTPTKQTTVRAGYSQSLGGVSIDQSFRLEPVQVAGFNQAYRSIIPESIAGANSAARFTTHGVSVEQRFGRATFLGAAVEWLESDVRRSFGTFGSRAFGPVLPNQTREHLEYDERSLSLSASQLLGDEWSVGARYRLSDAELRDQFRQPPLSVQSEALLHELTVFAVFNHHSGFFAEAETTWHAQHNAEGPAALDDDSLWQVHLHGGYRFAQRRAEVRVGVLNITDNNYRLNPLNLVGDLPRERTFVASLRFHF